MRENCGIDYFFPNTLFYGKIPCPALVTWMRRAFSKVALVTGISFCIMVASTGIASAYPAGQLVNVTYMNQRIWAAWVGSDVNGDGWREMVVCGAIYTRCFDINPAHSGPSQLWEQQRLHHEVLWGCDSGIDVNGDGVTEQLTFETVWNIHYLLDGKTGVAIQSTGEDNRRPGLYWPSTDCGTGLNGTDVNENGIDDYVITGIDGGSGPVLRCVEGQNGSTIWSVALTGTPGGVRIVTANNSLRIMTWADNIALWFPNGTGCGNIGTGGYLPSIIPNRAGLGHDAVVCGNQVNNLSDSQLLFTSPVNLQRTFYCGDVNNDGIGDYGGVYADGKKVAVVSGSNGALLRNHTAQNLNNYMHGVIGVGDLNGDGYADYGIFGDFDLCEIFSGQSGTAFLQIQVSLYGNPVGVEELFSIPDVNGNGYSDIMTFSGMCVNIIDGSARGLVNAEISWFDPVTPQFFIYLIILICVIAGLSVTLVIVIVKYRKLARK